MGDGQLTRRAFLKGAAVTGAAAALGGAAACSPAPAADAPPASGAAAPDGGAASGGETTATGSKVHAWEMSPEPITDIVAEENFDIVVIGAGISGASAAYAATAAGASVALVEKFDTYTAHGNDICAVGSRLQEQEGIKIDKDLVTRLIYQWGQSEANYFLIKTFVERSGEVMDHYLDMADASGYVVVLNTEMTARSDWDTLDDRFKQFRTAHKFTLPEGSSIPEQMWTTGYFIEMVLGDAEAKGAAIRYNTDAKQLVKDADKVVAVIVQDAEGYKRLNVSRGVILATGGITDNDEMKSCFCPISLRCDHSEYFPPGGNMGDGIVMGAQIGAQLSPCYPAPIIHPVNLSVMGPGFDTSWLSVNRDGMRYCCEVGWEPIVTNARMNTPGSVSWAIFDSHYAEHAQRQEPIKSQAFLEGLAEKVETEVESGAFFKGETLAELAAAINVPADTLQKTVDRYNEMCDSGVDRDFGVPPRFLSSVKDGPFFAANVAAWLLALPYGLRCDQNSQVLDADDKPIGGLFAIGNVQGDFFANSYPVTLPGTSHGRGVVFGYLVGQALATDSTIDGYSMGFVD
jgi:succinate dehydrogenase/fumarate reductase flavoprotein subunit